MLYGLLCRSGYWYIMAETANVQKEEKGRYYYEQKMERVPQSDRKML